MKFPTNPLGFSDGVNFARGSILRTLLMHNHCLGDRYEYRKKSLRTLGRRPENRSGLYLDRNRRTARSPYGFKARFEGGKGTNPEELIGAAHAGCFSMAFSMILGDAGLKADSIDTQAEVTLDQVDGGFAITAVHLILKAKIPGASQTQFDELSKKAKEGCPVSKVLNATITLDGTLVS